MHPVDDDGVRFRVLVPIWGERYIRDFCAISLPALLADGNLPGLIRRAPTEIIFLTTRTSQKDFEVSDGIRRIRDYCPYSFVFIDDLLPYGSYGIILTAAYGRGIASLGDLQTSTYFVFLNADFVLSDGILRTVVDRIGKGFNAVMAPSLRSRQEDVIDDLQGRVSRETGTLAASPSQLVRLTLDSLHLTARASVVNQSAFHHNAANQFFWRVDDTTLIARFFLLFMLCIRPERPFTTCVGWCDYAFVPELVPSGNYDVIADSDDGFILEMQAHRGDIHYVRSGRITPKEFAPRLSVWTTANHRADAARTIVLHTGPLPANFAAVEKEADAFMTELFGHLRQPPTSHLRHIFWTSALLHNQDKVARNEAPPELPRYVPKRPEAIRYRRELRRQPGRLANDLARMLVGDPLKPRRLHAAYLDYRNFAAQIGALRAQCRDLLHVREMKSPLDAFLQDGSASTSVTLPEIAKRPSDDKPFDGAIVTVMDHSAFQLPRLLRLVAAHCKDGAPVLVCIDAVDSVFIGGRHTIYGDAIGLIGGDVPPGITVEDCALITAPERLTPAYLLVKTRQLVESRRFSARIAALLVAPPAYLQLFLINLRAKSQGVSAEGTCTSATIWFRGPWRSAAKTLAERALRFDPTFYRRTYPDVAAAGVDPEDHYATYGWKEGRDPSAHFSTSGYFSANGDVAKVQVNPLEHFRDHGLAEGRNGWQT